MTIKVKRISAQKLLLMTLLTAMLLPSTVVFAEMPSDKWIQSIQNSIKGIPLGQRIALWADMFVGTPYDTDPMGNYVTTQRIVTDGQVDCMYHTFRSVELALASSPTEARETALTLRFSTRGVINSAKRVQNYNERYAYAMDMLSSGKWGEDITEALAPMATIPGARGYDTVQIILKDNILASLNEFESGDIVFFIKPPRRRVVGEIVGHLGILKREGKEIYLIHASGSKGGFKGPGGGEVKKVLFHQYIKNMKFEGIKVTRF
jgi:hypothetical protein